MVSRRRQFDIDGGLVKVKKIILLFLFNLFFALNLYAQIYPSSAMPSKFDLTGLWIREVVQNGNIGLGAYFLFDKDTFNYYLSSTSNAAMWSGRYTLNAGQITFVIQKYLGVQLPEERFVIYNAYILKKDTDDGDIVGISFTYGLILEAPNYFIPSHFN
jgi:hypothetical protein